jgi:deoxyribonuclease-1
MAFRASILAVFLVFTQTALALAPSDSYYGKDFQQTMNTKRDGDLVSELRKIISLSHMRSKDGYDTIADHCDTAQQGCYQHKSLGYNVARQVMFGKLYLESNGSGYAIDEVYCQRLYGADDFHKGPMPGPNVIPNHSVMNAEHTWPQSKFNRRFDTGMQKSDLHHIFPSDTEMNGARGNYNFGEVAQMQKELKCPQSKLGFAPNSTTPIFEPPDHHKGNVARALFYFSVRYQIPINSIQEETLKRWNKADPVDQADRDRNDQIQQVQGNRNPFVDHPELADLISDF